MLTLCKHVTVQEYKKTKKNAAQYKVGIYLLAVIQQ